jgi:hypothetical protein
VGKTSEARTHEIGPKLREKIMEVRKMRAIPARWAAALVVVASPAGKEAMIAERAEKLKTKKREPKRSGFLRPTRSRRKRMKLPRRSVTQIVKT